MSALLDQFFGDAKRMQLSEQEKVNAWGNILAKTSAKSIALTSTEKAESFNAVCDHMRRNPIVTPQRSFNYFSWIYMHRLTASILSVVLLVGAGGSVVYGAEGAMPDELLYPVKLHLNEPMIDMFHKRRPPERRAEWEARKLERRMKEAEHLSRMQEKFTPEKRAFFEARIENRIQHLQEKLSQVSEDKRDVIQVHVEQNMKRHEAVLEKIQQGTLKPQEIMRYKKRMQDARKNVIKTTSPKKTPENKLKLKDLRSKKPKIIR